MTYAFADTGAVKDTMTDPQNPQPYGQQQHEQAYGQQQHEQAYGQQQYPQQAYGPGQFGGGYAQPAPNNGLGVAGFVCGLIGLIFCWVPVFGLLLGVLGVILGGAGISAGSKSGAGNGLAISGLVLGIISLIPAIIILVAIAGSN